jgi:hypothetical protein
MVWVLGAAVFLVSFSLLAFEITLTRVLSVLLFYHYVFIVISLALLGLGSGGILVHVLNLRRPSDGQQFRGTGLFAGLFALSIPLSLILMTRITSVAGWGDNTVPYLLLLFIPFFFAGALLSSIFNALPAESSRLYAMDLVGAAAGSLTVILLLNRLGGMASGFLLGTVAAVAAVVIAVAVPGKKVKQAILPVLSLATAVVLFVSSAAGLYLPDVPIGKTESKEITSALNEPSLAGQIVETRWSAFGRTDLVASRTNPEGMTIYVDGTAGTEMYRFDGDINNPGQAIESLKTTFPGYLPFTTLREGEKDSALIIGPGGGRDVLMALMGGVKKITAVEVNKELVDIMDKYKQYNGGLYTGRKDVTVTVAEGRNFLKRQKEKYDVIFLSIPVTKTSRSLEGYVLTENFLFTTDAIKDYVDHLTDEGRLVIVAHNSPELFKLLSVSLEALSQRGIDNGTAMNQIYVVGAHMYPVFVLKKTPLDKQEVEAIHKSVHDLNYDLGSTYLPSLKAVNCPPHSGTLRYDECNMLNPALLAVSMRQVNFDVLEKTIASQTSLNVSPVGDDNPFFYNFEQGLPKSISLVLWASVFLLSVVITAPLVYRRKRMWEKSGPGGRSPVKNDLPRFAIFFAALGIGFMLVEISAIQRFTLFLGQPILSLSAVLFSLLLGAGLGSIFSGRFSSEKITKVVTIASLSVAVILAAYAFSLPPILKQLLGMSLPLRLATTIVLSGPLGFVMGFLFPSGIRLLKDTGMERYIPWMWGINGFASVVGSVLTVSFAISSGFTLALLSGVGFYLVALLCVRWGFRLPVITQTTDTSLARLTK